MQDRSESVTCPLFQIASVVVGKPLERKKRDFVHDDELEALYKRYRSWRKQPAFLDDEVDTNSSLFKMTFDDTLYKKQWYLVSLSIGKISVCILWF